MRPLLTDAELVARSVHEPAVFAGLYERHGLTVRRYIARRIGAAADDVASEVFVRAFGARSRYRATHEVALPWLLGIANNVLADHRRLERRRLRALERLTVEAVDLVEHDDAGLAAELVGAIRRLPAAERDTLLLVVLGELTQGEAASALGVPIGTVSSRITRARKSLTAVLGPTPSGIAAEVRMSGETNA